MENRASKVCLVGSAGSARDVAQGAPIVLGGKDGLVGLDSDRSAGRVNLRGADSQASGLGGAHDS